MSEGNYQEYYDAADAEELDKSMTFKVGQEIRYTSYGTEKVGVISRIGRSGILFLADGKFLFPKSVIGLA